MKRTVLLTLTILILTFPAPCQATVGPQPVLELSRNWHQVLDLDLGLFPSELATPGLSTPEFFTAAMRVDESDLNLLALENGPDDALSLMSFVWAEMTGAVDIVREVRIYSRNWRNKRQHLQVATNRSTDNRPDPRNRWKIVVGCRVDDNMELSARFDTRGHLFNEKSITWQLSAADLLPDNVGLTTVYRDGGFMVEADRVSVPETAMAKVVVRF